MAEKIRYDDSIFFLTALIRALSDGVRLNVDTDFFADKIIEDALFIDSSIQRLHSSLKENTHLIRRNAHLHSIMKLKKTYTRLLEDLLGLDGAAAEPYRPVGPKLRRIIAGHLNDVKEIRDTLNGTLGVRTDSDMISYDELNYLMSPMDDAGEVDD